MNEKHRSTARELAHKHLDAGDPLGWFENLYARAESNSKAQTQNVNSA